jgi:hypothetical protein
MDFQGFKSYVDGIGMSAGNRYTVQIPFLSEQENALCCQVDLQSDGFETFRWTGQRPYVTLPYELKYEPLPMTFYCADDGAPYNKLFDWQSRITDENFLFQDFDNYASGNNIIVMELNRQNSVIGTYKYFNCYPLSIGAKTLSYENKSMVNKFPVQFYFEFMTHE